MSEPTTDIPDTDIPHNDTTATDPRRMECMELWGGSSETSTGVAMTGLAGQVDSRAYGAGQDGGDVYYFSSCASGRISRVLLADVTGHGEEVAKTGSALRDVMRRNVNVIRQSSLMSAVNEEFGEISRSGGFATAVVITHFAPTRSLTISVAGHPPPLLYRQSVGRWAVIDDAEPSEGVAMHDLPLGITSEVDYTTTSLTFGPGDSLLMYTDAFSEARNGDGEMLGPQGLLKIVNDLPARDAKTLIPGLIARLKELSPENLVDDDATIIVLQPTGRRIPMKDNLLAPFRMLRGVTDTAS